MFMGANQNWFKDKLMRYRGCGPTTGTNLMINNLSINLRDKKELLLTMNELYELMKPHAGGVYVPQFIDGCNQYCVNHNINQKFKGFWLKSNLRKDKRRDDAELYENAARFIQDATYNNKYVAFMNLHNGGVRGLYSWHWVTIIGINNEVITILDNEKIKLINFKTWYNQGLKRGGLVTSELSL